LLLKKNKFRLRLLRSKRRGGRLFHEYSRRKIAVHYKHSSKRFLKNRTRGNLDMSPTLRYPQRSAKNYRKSKGKRHIKRYKKKKRRIWYPYHIFKNPDPAVKKKYALSLLTPKQRERKLHKEKLAKFIKRLKKPKFLKSIIKRYGCSRHLLMQKMNAGILQKEFSHVKRRL
jgi:hypothetical protein